MLRLKSPAALRVNKAPLLILISAPSGGGKTTLCHELLTARPEMTRAITCTTRDPRPGEKDGVDYYFLDGTSFLKRVQAGNFLEHANVYGNSYGTLKSEVLDKLRKGKDVLLNIDVQGAAAVRGGRWKIQNLSGRWSHLSHPAFAWRFWKHGSRNAERIRRLIFKSV